MEALQKQLAHQKEEFEAESKANDQLKEEHERELRHLKRDIKHKLVSRYCLLLMHNLMSNDCCAAHEYTG